MKVFPILSSFAKSVMTPQIYMPVIDDTIMIIAAGKDNREISNPIMAA